jgi:G3E family GTPase
MDSRSPAPVPIIILSAMDRVARESAAVGLLLDLPDVAVVTHDLVGGTGGEVRRVITDRTGRLVDDTMFLEHACLNCTVRENVVPTLQMVLARGGWRTLVLALPLAAAPGPVAYAISTAIAAGTLPDARLAGVVSLVEEDTFVTDLLDDDLLAERGLALGAVDRRAVGEALASQVEYADVVVTVTEGDARSRTLLQHVVAPTTQLHLGWHQLPVADLVKVHHDLDQARRRVDPLTVQPTGATDHEGVWTVDLRSARPLHPERLAERIEDLGVGRLRGRGHFWLPTRPDMVCAWDGAGGQVSIGTVARWARRRRQTRLVVTGVDPADRRRVAEAFTAIVMDQEEYAARARWTGIDDGLDAWLGERESAA